MLVCAGPGSGRLLKRWHPESFRPDVELNRRVIDRIERKELISMRGMAAEEIHREEELSHRW
jgi:hypothetical protein